jgi:hypothetical protein
MKELNFDKETNEDIIAFRIQIDKEIKKRGIKFNVGDVGEILAIKHFNDTPGLSNLQKAPTGTKNVDALSRNGERYSIKTIKDGNKTGTVYPDTTNKEKQLFEYLLLVQIDDDYKIISLHRFSWEQFKKIKQWDKTMNAWYISKSNKALSQGELIYERK